MEETDNESRYRVIYEHVNPTKHLQAYQQPKPDPIPEEWWDTVICEAKTFEECQVWYRDLVNSIPANLFRNIRLQATTMRWTTIIPGSKS